MHRYINRRKKKGREREKLTERDGEHIFDCFCSFNPIERKKNVSGKGCGKRRKKKGCGKRKKKKGCGKRRRDEEKEEGMRRES